MLTNEVKQLAVSLGADIIGVAPAGRLSTAPGYNPTDLLQNASSVVVMGKRVLRAAIGRGRGRSISFMLTHLNIKLNEIAYEVARLLDDKGYEALPILFTTLMLSPLKAEEFPKEFSYKHAAVEAGLGEIGLSQLLITPQFGPRVRLVAVITSVALQPDETYEGKLCDGEKCGYRCISACPAKALSENGELNWNKCTAEIWRYLHRLGYAYCAACMSVCPVGK